MRFLPARSIVLLAACALGAVMSVTASAAPAVAASGPAPGVDDDWTRGAHTLLGFVPREVRMTCEVREPVDEPGVDDRVLDAERGALLCSAADDAIDVRYVRFASSDDADAYVDQLTDPEPTDDQADDPGDCPTQFRIQRGGDADVGRYVCFLASDIEGVDDGTPVITWTYAPRAIVAQAYDADLDLARLRKFWANVAGPLDRADRRGIPPLPTTASLRAKGKQLLAAVPEASRRDCHVIDSLTPDAIGGAFPSRLWIVADVEECRPERGSTDTEYMQFATAGATDAYLGDLPESYTNDRRVTVDGTKCGGRGTYQDDGRRAGRYLCWFSTDDTDAQESTEEFAHVLFSDTRNRVVVSGGAPAAKVEALLAWWKDDARLD